MRPKKRNRRNKQDENRNIIPNIVHQILAFVQKKTKSEKIITRIFEHYNRETSWTVRRFYLYQLKLKDKIDHYVNKETLELFAQLLEPNCEVYS